MNYQQAIKDYANGSIDPHDWVVVFDNDGGYWRYQGSIKDEDEIEELEDQMEKRYGSPDGYRDLVEIAVAAGMNAEWC